MNLHYLVRSLERHERRSSLYAAVVFLAAVVVLTLWAVWLL